jgi:hypothetical protein
MFRQFMFYSLINEDNKCIYVCPQIQKYGSPLALFATYVLLHSLLIEARNTKLEEVFRWNLTGFDYPDDTSQNNSTELKSLFQRSM